MTAANADIAKMSFEQAMAELEKIVESLERGDADLEKSIAIYERGTALKSHCEAKLKDAQGKIEKITLDPATGAVRTEPFQAG